MLVESPLIGCKFKQIVTSLQNVTDVFKQMRQDGTMKEIAGRYLDDPETFLEVDELEQ